jgi:hypothetical protein
MKEARTIKCGARFLFVAPGLPPEGIFLARIKRQWHPLRHTGADGV